MSSVESITTDMGSYTNDLAGMTDYVMDFFIVEFDHDPEVPLVFAPMIREKRDTWCASLRRGDRAQIQAKLKARRADGTVGYCCLGIAAEDEGCQATADIVPDDNHRRYVEVWTFEFPSSDGAGDPERNDSMLSDPFLTETLGITDPRVGHALANANDSGFTFPVIADWIEDTL